MGSFYVLRPYETKWSAILDTMNYDVRDIHFRPEFARVADDGPNGVSLLAVYEGDDFTVCQALKSREFQGSWDVTSMGYGGPICNATIPSRSHGEEFDRELRRWYHQLGVIADFTLFNPLFEPEQFHLACQLPGEQYLEKSVAVMLCDDREAMIGRMRSGRRYNLRNAEKNGITVHEARPTKDALMMWLLLYRATMERHGASPRWREAGDRVESLFKECGDRAALIFVDGQAPLVGAVILFGTSVAYYHLAGTVDRLPQGAGELAILKAAEMAAARGCRWLHLGGGASAFSDDPLLDFKMSFGSIKVPVYSRRRIVDVERYKALSKGTEGTSYFPAYRMGEAL